MIIVVSDGIIYIIISVYTHNGMETIKVKDKNYILHFPGTKIMCVI
jgi:hypothetical protein